MKNRFYKIISLILVCFIFTAVGCSYIDEPTITEDDINEQDENYIEKSEQQESVKAAEELGCVVTEETDEYYEEYIPIGESVIRFDDADKAYLNSVLKTDATCDVLYEIENPEVMTYFVQALNEAAGYAADNDRDSIEKVKYCSYVSEYYHNNEFSYFYSFFEPSGMDKYIIYFVYKEIDGGSEYIGVWGSNEKLAADNLYGANYEELKNIALEDMRIPDLIDRGAVFDLSYATFTYGLLFLNYGNMAYVDFKNYSFEDGRENDYYLICDCKKLWKMNLKDIVKEEHLPEKLFEEFAEQES